MLKDLCELVRAQAFEGVHGVYSHYIPQGSTLPAIRIKRKGHDPMQCLGADDEEDLAFTMVEFTVAAEQPAATFDVAEALRGWIAGYVGAMGSRTVVGVVMQTDLEDVEQAPVDGSDVWYVGVQFTAQIQHKPA